MAEFERSPRGGPGRRARLIAYGSALAGIATAFLVVVLTPEMPPTQSLPSPPIPTVSAQEPATTTRDTALTPVSPPRTGSTQTGGVWGGRLGKAWQSARKAWREPRS